MDNATPKSVPKIRTFADDFAAAQNHHQELDTTKPTIPLAKQTATQEEPATESSDEALQADVAHLLPEQPIVPAAPAAGDNTYLAVAVGDEYAKETDTFDENLESVEFVREKKRNKFRLFPAIKQSMQSWYTDTKEDLTAIPPESQVEDPRLREATVEQAVGTSALPDNDDHTVLAAHIAGQPKVAAEHTLQVTPTSELPTPQWSSNLTPATSTSSTSSTSKTESGTKSTAAVPVADAVSAVAEPAPPPSPDPIPTPIPQPKPVQLVTPAAKPTSVPKEDTVEEDLVATATPEVAPELDTGEYRYRPTPAEPAPRDWRWWLVIASVSIAAIVLGVTISVWVYQYLAQPEHVLAPAIPSAITVDGTQPVTVTDSSGSLLNKMRTALQAGTGVTQVYPIVTTTDGTTRVATLNEFLTTVPLSADGSFQRNITGLTIIGHNQQVGVLLEVASFETALGGMYTWEPQLVTDLGALLGASPISQFTDTTSDNRDIRVAKRGDGSELLYTFLNRNTLLIATDRALIGEVITRLK